MALYWPEARVAVACEGASRTCEQDDWPPEVVLVSMREGQEEQPEFVEAVRSLVLERTWERRREAAMELCELSLGMPEPRGGELREGAEPTPGDRAEARLREALLGKGERAGDEPGGIGDERLWEGGGWDVPAVPLGIADWGALGAQVVIHHCDEVVVTR